YAETWAKRLGEGLWGPHTPRRFFTDAHWKEPLKWDKDAAKDKVRRRVFCASMADVFENRPDLVAERRRLLDLIDQTPNLDWLLLTKRIHLVRKQLPKGYEFPKNVWLGTTVEDQATAQKRIKYLLEFSSPSVRFLSCEPLLSAIDLSPYLIRNEKGNRVDWVIAGGESGPHARPMDPIWPAALQKQCDKAKVPFHFKQWGHWAPVHQVQDVVKKSTPIRVIRQDGSEVSVAAIGKAKAGRVLAGKHWDQFPRTVA
ncbi:MAG: phage Gp37/Gp68 family protein, partial [Paraburkholderia sp.]|nr:phage Gp37/Gp68 family protein [Paraburkholderia sp.]